MLRFFFENVENFQSRATLKYINKYKANTQMASSSSKANTSSINSSNNMIASLKI